MWNSAPLPYNPGMRRYVPLLVFLLIALVPAQDLASRAEAIIKEVQEKQRIPGLSVSISRGETVLLEKGYGRVDIENELPATKDSVFRIGSITKQFTAAMIMKLVEEGKLSLDDSVQKHVPTFPKKKHPVTVRNLLNHTSGIRSYTSQKDRWRKVSRLDLSHEKLLDVFAKEPLQFAPGTRWHYSNSGYYLLGMIIEKVTGTTYQKHLRRAITAPLGLAHTHFDDSRRIIRNRARGYDVRDRGTRNADFISMKQPFAAGGLVSTSGDLRKWAQAFIAGNVVRAATRDQMTTRTVIANEQKVDYGLGFAIGDIGGRKVIAHSGSINGFSSDIRAFPSSGVVVVVLANCVSRGPGELGVRLADIALE